MIRFAQHADIDAMVALGALFYDSTPHAAIIPYNPVSTRFLIAAMIDHPDSLALVLERDGAVVGGIAGTLAPFTFNMDHMSVLENFWFVHPEHRCAEALQLEEELEAWAWDRGAAMVIMGAFPGAAAVLGRHYRRRGYAPAESLYIKGRPA